MGALAGCISGPPQPAPVPARVQDANRAVVVVSGSQSGAQVTVQRPQALQVELASDVRSVSQGYEWLLSDTDPTVLTAEAPRFERAPRDVNVFESAGTTLWRFRPTAAGRVQLQFALRQPRQRDPPLEVVRFDVTVK